MIRKSKTLFTYAALFGMLFIPAVLPAQDKPAYRIFSAEGKEVDYTKMMKAVRTADIVFFGESHNNALAHWLELQVTRSLYETNNTLILGMEMFEADNQLVLNEYLNGVIEEKHLLKEAKIWDNYKTDYKPLVDFAKEKKLPVIATNIPRRYANLVYKIGIHALDSLSEESKRWIAPLPITVDMELKNYKELVNSMGQHGGGNAQNLAIAQACKDATMAYFILKNKKDNTFLHFNGAYHSQDHEGIVWYLEKMNPNNTIKTIHIAEQDDIDKLEEANKNKADFIICIPVDMTKTY